MSEPYVRVAILGGVRHALPYARLLMADPRVRVVGVADERSAPAWIRRAGEDLAYELDVPWSTDLESFVRADLIDLAVVCSEPTRHADLACLALEAGVRTCVDKPVATTVGDAVRVASASAGVAGFCAVVNRTLSPALGRLRSWVDAGHLGLPRHVDVEFLTSSAAFALDVEDPRLVVDPALSGGGELRNFLGYAVDAIRHLTGLEIEEVYAETASLFGGPHADHGVEDSGVVSMLLQHGVTATATIGRVPAVPAIGTAHSTIRVFGSHGSAVACDERPRVLRFGGETVSSAPVDGGGGRVAIAAFFRDVIDRLLSGGATSYTVADARAGVEVIDAAYRSSEVGRNVALPSAS